MVTSDKTRKLLSDSKKRFIEENGTSSFGNGKIYVRHPETNKLTRIDKCDLGKYLKNNFTLSTNAKNKLIKEGYKI
jgi:hypothetical protein